MFEIIERCIFYFFDVIPYVIIETGRVIVEEASEATPGAGIRLALMVPGLWLLFRLVLRFLTYIALAGAAAAGFFAYTLVGGS